VLMLKMLVKPGWALAASTGAAFAATHFLKSSMLAALGLFVVAYTVRLAFFKPRPRWKFLAREAGMGALVPLVFLALLSPYLAKSKSIFGSFFFSAHTKYHLWVDTHDESRALVSMKVSRQRPNFDEQWLRASSNDYERERIYFDDWRRNGLPGARRYFREHGWREIAETLVTSADRAMDRLKRDYRGAVRYLDGLLGVLLAALVVNFSDVRRLWSHYWLPISTYLLFMGGYFLAYVFYAKIGMGPRLFLALVMPLMTGMAIAILHLGRDLPIAFGAHDLSFRKLGNWALVAVLAHSALRVLTDHIHWVAGGQ
jgi:hypothetical protein